MSDTVENQLSDIKCPLNLAEMFRYARPAWSQTEKAFIKRFITPLNPEIDEFGNRWVIVGENPHIMFSSHTDTVHRTDKMQSVVIGEDGWISTADGATECLGADCTAGVWLMVEMIKAKVPGVYVFHREEESGGVGSRYIAKHLYYLLDGIQAAIAFDRRGFTSIITRQSGGRCCSDEFAVSLGKAMSGDDQEFWKLDTGGSFTDTAAYTKIIPECTNISVGYQNAHSSNELQYFPFLVELRNALVLADWSKLVIKRDPKEVEYSKYSSTFQGRGKTNSGYYANASYSGYPSYHNFSGSSSTEDKKFKDLQDLIRTRPDFVAKALVELDISADEMIEMVQDDMPESANSYYERMWGYGF